MTEILATVVLTTGVLAILTFAHNKTPHSKNANSSVALKRLHGVASMRGVSIKVFIGLTNQTNTAHFLQH